MIVCVAANPSIDKLFEVRRLRPGTIHRPVRMTSVAGGKGLNVARAARTLGARVVAVPLLAGHAGRWVEDELQREGVATAAAWAGAGETRSSLSVADEAAGDLTEFYEDGANVTPSDWDALEGAVRRSTEPGGWVTISGSLPPGAPADGYSRLVAVVRAARASVAVDTHGPALADSMEASPDLVKVNEEEAAEALDRPIGTDAEAVEAAVAIAERSAGAAVAVTRGAAGCVLVAAGERLRGTVGATGPYPVGSGDAFLAGLVTGRDRAWGWAQALPLALGAAAANAEERGAGRLRAERATELSRRASIATIA